MSDRAKSTVDSTSLRGRLNYIFEKHPQIFNGEVKVLADRDQLVEDLCVLIARLPASSDQIAKLYRAVTGKMISKTCNRCLKLKPVVDGVYQYPGGDLSKPKQFICGDCNK
jgi:hypothetical protein